MPSHDDSTLIGAENAFHPDFLTRIEHQDDPLTAAEAVHGGIWFVRPLTDGRGYGVYRFWEDPAKGDEPFAVLKERSTAYVAAAFLPASAKDRTLWSQPSEDKPGQTLYRYGDAIGHLRYREEEFVEVLNLGEALARSPESIAAFLEAAGYAALEPAGKILARGALGA